MGRSLGILAGNLLAESGQLPDGISEQEVGAVVQAACLAHDIGNPPFGHAGEYAIRHWFEENADRLKVTGAQKADLTIFEGNAQGFRIVTKTENHLFSGGLRLTYATLGTLVKYPWGSGNLRAQSKGKFNFFSTEHEHALEIMRELGLEDAGEMSRHPLSYLMEAADDICYRVIDIEDALALGMLQFEQAGDILKKIAGVKYFEDIGPDHASRNRLSPLRSKAIDNLIQHCFEVFEANYDLIMSGDFCKDLLSHLSGPVAEGLADAKRITQENIFLHRRKIELELGAYTNLATIIESLIEAVHEMKDNKLSFKSKRVLDLMGKDRVADSMEMHDCYMRVIDYVSGMTDNHAVHVANQISGRAI